MKKILSLTLTIISIIVFIFTGQKDVYASDGTLTITPSATSVSVEQDFDVVVRFTYNDKENGKLIGINVIEMNLQYDTSKVSFVSAQRHLSTDKAYGSYDAGSPAGVIALNYMEMQDDLEYVEWKLTFKAKETGSTNFTTSNATILNMKNETLNPVKSGVLSSSAVSIKTQGSDDSTLSSLSVVGRSLSPAFSPNVYAYKSYVENTITSVGISAISAQGGRTEITGDPANLQVGKNTVQIKCYAPDGSSSTYTVEIIRSEAADTPTEPETAAPTETTDVPINDNSEETESETETVVDGEIVVSIAGEKYTVSKSFDTAILPKGYEINFIQIEDMDVLTGKNTEGIIIAYLTDEENNGAFYIYDVSKKAYYPLYIIERADKSYTYIPKELSGQTLDNLKEKNVQIDGMNILMYGADDSDFVYFYGVGSNGTKGWFCYDTKEDTIQRANNEMIISETTASSDADKTENSSEELLKQISNLKNTRTLMCIIAVVIFVFMMVIIIAIAAHKSQKKYENNIDVDKFIEEEKKSEQVADDIPEDTAENEAEDVTSLSDEIQESESEPEQQDIIEVMPEDAEAELYDEPVVTEVQHEEEPEKNVGVKLEEDADVVLDEEEVSDADVKKFNKEVIEIANENKDDSSDEAVEIINLSDDDDDYFL